jgi:phosphoglucosamine mutase
MAETTRATTRVQEALGAEGRILIRWSGTEPKLRIMVEGPDEDQIRVWAREIAASARKDVPAES